MSEPSSKRTDGAGSRAPFPTEAEAAPGRLSWPRAPLPSVLGVFVLFALFAVVVHYVVLPRSTGVFPDDGIRTAEQRAKNLAELHAKEAKQLAGYAWVDQKNGVVQLPLDRAMELTLQRYQQSPSR